MASENLRNLLSSKDGPPVRIVRDTPHHCDMEQNFEEAFSPIVYRRGLPLLCCGDVQNLISKAWHASDFSRSVVITQEPNSFEKRQLLAMWNSDISSEMEFHKSVSELSLIFQDAMLKIDNILLLRSESMVETVAPKWGAAAITCGEHILFTNQKFNELFGLKIEFADHLVRGRLRLSDLVSKLIGGPFPALHSIGPDGVLLKLDGGRRMHLEVTPVRGERSGFFGARKLVTLEQAAPEGVNLEDLLRSAYRLTATEARIVRRLVEGADAKEIEREANIRHDTLKTHLRNIFEKTGVHRQVALVGLAASLVMQVHKRGENVRDARP